jgi:hypothetical protein
MGTFYTIQYPENKRLMLYSERGLLSHLFHDMLIADPFPMLEAATNATGISLRKALDIQHVQGFAVYTEFDLGAQGFGSPDGGLLLIGERRRAFIFIEGKAILFPLSFKDPDVVAQPIRDLNWDLLDLDRIMRDNIFNSSINGQMELKWRFVNALRKSPLSASNQQFVTEQAVKLPLEILKCDRFYWRRRLNPRPEVTDDWRRVEVGGELRQLFKDLRPVEDYYLLAITADTEAPVDYLKRIRLFTEDGAPLEDASRFIYWLPIEFISKHLHSISISSTEM